MRLDESNLILWGIALILIVIIARRQGFKAVLGAGPGTAQSFFILLPRMIFALLTAGFVGKIIPGEMIAGVIGEESGVGGVLVASILGGFVPGGPIISFPIVVVLQEAGAGLPQLIAFLTAWSVLAFHRVLIYELTMMGWRFSILRLASSLILAPVAGLTTLAVVQMFPALQ